MRIYLKIISFCPALLFSGFLASCEWVEDVTPKSENVNLPDPVVNITKDELTVLFPYFCLYDEVLDDDIQVPNLVKEKFKAGFSTAQNIKWEGNESLDLYEVEFEINGKKYEALYKSNGELIVGMVEIPVSQVPQIVKDGVKGHFGEGWEIENARRVKAIAGTFYKLELENQQFDEDDDRNAFFDSEGNYINDCFDDDIDDPDDDDPDKLLSKITGQFTENHLNLFLRYLCEDDDAIEFEDDDITVPSNVKDRFRQDFTDAGNVEWEMSVSPDWFKADFKITGKNHKAVYDKTPDLLSIVFKISLSEIPENIKNKVSSHYGQAFDFEDDKSEKIFTATGIFYKFSLDFEDSDDVKAVFDSTGKFVLEVH